MKIRASLACLAWLLLGSCGGGGGGGEGNTLPLASTPSVSFGDKQLHFAWTAATGATFYRLSESTDGVAAYAVVIDNLAVTHYDFVLTSLFVHINAKFKLEACNSNGCTPSVLNMPDNLSTALGAYVKASNTGGGDNFGATVAISADGNTLAVGAPGEASASTGVTATPPNNTATGDAASFAGAVYVFFRSGGAWSQQAYVKASNTGANDFFGFSVFLSGDGNTLAVGAVGEASAATGVNPNPGQGDNSLIAAGAVYVFTRSGAAWSQQAYIKSLSPSQGDFFGNAVTLNQDGSTLAVGVPFENSAATGVGGNNVSDCATTKVNCADNSGAVYVFTRSGATWSEQAYVKASNTGAGDQFGFSVSLSGDGNLLAVGAPAEDSALTDVTINTANAVNEASAGNGAMDAGAVYTFKRVTTTWSPHTYVKASNTGAGDGFGTAVALSSDAKTLAVGAPNEDSDTVGVSPTNPAPGNNDSALSAGAVYVFNRLTGPDTWGQQAYVKASNTGASDIFGVCMALSGDGNTLAVGAADAGDIAGIIPGAPDVTTTHNTVASTAGSSGAVYRFTRAGTVWTQQAYVKATNLEANDLFGATNLGSGVIALSSDGSAMAVGAVHEASAATGVGGNQANDCTTAAPTNCAGSAGAVYLY
jgi:hypothetical protein